MTDISGLKKFLTEQPDKEVIAKLDYLLLEWEETQKRTADIKKRRNIKD